MSHIKIIFHNNKLSSIQLEEVKQFLPDLMIRKILMPPPEESVPYVLQGNEERNAAFSKNLYTALLNNEADVAVHSAKDLPYPLPEGLEVIALTESAYPQDALISAGNKSLRELLPGTRIGLSSQEGSAQLTQIRSDLSIVPVSGDIEDGLALFNSGQIDALVVDLSALKQLELSYLVTEILPYKTHPLQGSTVLVAKENNACLKSLFHQIDIRRNYGKVCFAFYSPGKEDYLPLQTVKALKQAEVIYFEEATDHTFLNNFKCKKVNIGSRKPEDVHELIYRAALEGRQVVRLVSDTVEGQSMLIREKAFLRKCQVYSEKLAADIAEGESELEKGRNRILVTGNNPVRYEYLGDVIHTPLVESLPLKNYNSFLDTLPAKNDFDWILFTSSYAVRYFFQALTDNEIDIRWLAGSRIISIGPSTTRELKANRILCDLEAEKDTISGIIDLFQERNLLGRKILLPGPEGWFNSLQGYFEKVGYKVFSVPVFRNHSPQVPKEVDLKEIDIVVFSSPSDVKNFKSLYREWPEHMRVISADEATTRELYIAGILEYSDWVI